MERRYHFESFSSEMGSFDSKFDDFINKKYSDGWKYKDCYYQTSGDKTHAFCVFKRLS